MSGVEERSRHQVNMAKCQATFAKVYAEHFKDSTSSDMWYITANMANKILTQQVKAMQEQIDVMVAK
eukprot:8899463-Ditylum_brightwellii.AAC.1